MGNHAYDRSNSEEIARQDNWIETLMTALALIGGAWVTVQLIKSFGKKAYHCNRCKTTVVRATAQCPSCGAGLNWDKTNA